MNERHDSLNAITRMLQSVTEQHFPSSTLYVIATPIGNITDISIRALHVLSLMDAIACEDTRKTGTLLSQYGISKELMMVHQHNERQSANQIVSRLLKGERIGFVSDAGTPAISDPGARLVDTVRSAGQQIMPVPGASAVITALSASGFLDEHFYFVGFLPARKTACETLLKTLVHIPATLVFYEAPHRVKETLESLHLVFGPERQIVIAREMTKLFEEIYRCSLSEARNWILADPNHGKGEFVLLVEGSPPDNNTDEAESRRILDILLRECSLRQAVTLASQITGVKKNHLYEQALDMKKDEK